MQNSDNVEKIDLDKIDWRSSREFFESLGEELDKLDDKDESYNFTWVGKRKSIIEAGAPINKTLRPDMEASKDFDNTKNMLIIGDNLDALKLLQESYLGKIKMIYIDPPYNTGHDFVYHDNFTVKKSDYEDNTTDSEGNKIISEDEFTENSKSNGRFHSDWLSMIYPRLKLARNLLTDDGVIFVSIDDSEQENLKKICNEIFGDDNFIATFIRQTRKGGGAMSKYVSTDHDYCIMYTKNINETGRFYIPYDENYLKRYSEEDENGRFFWDTFARNRQGSSNNYTITAPDGSILQNAWIYKKEKFNEMLKNGDVRIKKTNEGWSVQCKQRINAEGQIMRSLLTEYTNDSGTKEVVDLIGREIFTYVKPTKLIKLLCNSTNHDSIILDFFAGSGTTGHAVMDLNAEDGGNRKYILVQLDEPTDEKSEAKKAGYSTIDQITAERLRRAGDKIIKEHPDLEGKLDTGFRVFRIDSENENTDIRKPLKDVSQTDLFNSIDNIKKDRTPLDLLFGVVYASALPFDLKLETKKIGDNTVYLYGYLDEDSGLVACFDDNVSEDTIKEIAKLKPLTAAFKDSSFQDSAAKINLSEQFRVIAPDTKVKVI